MSNINVNIEEKDIDIRFVNRKSFNKIFKNKKKLAKLNNEKQNFREGTNIFVSESLTPMNEPIAFTCRKLKSKELIHSCYSRYGIIDVKVTDKSRPVKLFHMERLVNLFSDFNF